MRRVLVLAYYFPPHGGAGVQRTVKFLKHLPAFGYGAVVVTGPASTSLAWAPLDETLAADVPPTTEIHRIPGPEPSASSGWRGRSERWLRIEGSFSRWWVEGAFSIGSELVHGTDILYASMSPFETFEAAARIAAGTGKPWIADLRDPWALDEWSVFPTGLHRRLEERRMRSALASADAVILNTPEATRAALSRFPELRRRRVVTIPNGWDRDDFTTSPPNRDDRAFRIVHVGYVHTGPRRRHRRLRALRRVLGGATRGLDVQARSHAYLLEALDGLVAEQPSLACTLEVHLAGAAHTGVKHPLVRSHGYLPHAEAVTLLRSADLLFLPMHDLPGGMRARTVPGKTYEYLAARRPILAALPDGDARDLLSGLGTVHVCYPRDVDCMAKVVLERLGRGGEDETVAVTEAMLALYERRELTRRLAGVFDALVVGDQ